MARFRRRARSRHHTGMSPFRAGIIGIVVLGLFTFWGFSQINPFSSPYELDAVFENANNIKPRSPVRIAGVNVGEVRTVEPVGSEGAVRIRMEIQDKGLPIHEDAQMKIRSRIFLEGNVFIDLEPGSPTAPELEDGSTIPANQTATPVQFSQVLAALESDTREDLQTLLHEYSVKALGGADGEGARAYNRALRISGPTFRRSSLAAQATLGTEEGDFARLIRGQQRTFRALSRDQDALKSLITDFNTTAAAFAREDDALRATIPALDRTLERAMPALDALNAALPTLSAFSRDALPAARSSAPTLRASRPFIAQLRGLASERELRGLSRDLRQAIPDLAVVNETSVDFLEQGRALSACQNNVLVPFATEPIPDPDFPWHSGEPFYQEAPRGLVGLASESRVSDANSPYVRSQFGAGPRTVVSPGPGGQDVIAQAPFPIDGARPVPPDQRPVFRPNVPCETQDPPDLNAASANGDPGNYDPNPTPTRADRARTRRAHEELERVFAHIRRQNRGLPSVDPLQYSDIGERMRLDDFGLRLLSDGRVARGEDPALLEDVRRLVEQRDRREAREDAR